MLLQGFAQHVACGIDGCVALGLPVGQSPPHLLPAPSEIELEKPEWVAHHVADEIGDRIAARGRG